MPELPFEDEQYYDQNDDDEDSLTPEDMNNIISYVKGDTDDNPFPNRPVSGAGGPGGSGKSNSTEKSIRGAMVNKTNYPVGNSVKLTKKQLRDMSIEEAQEIVEDKLIEPTINNDKEDEELDEVSTCAGVAGVQAPLGTEIWGGQRPAKLPEDWEVVDEDDVQDPSIKKSFVQSMLYKNRGKQKRENKNMDRNKTIKLTESELDGLAEGIFSQLFTKVAGQIGGAKQGLTNKLYTAATGKDDTKDPKVTRTAIMASRTITSFKNNFAKLLTNYTEDIISIFGENPQNMPEVIKSSLNDIDESSTKFIEALDELVQSVDKLK